MTHRDADAAREWANVLGKRLRAARKRRGYGLCLKMEYAEVEGLLRVLQAASQPDLDQLAEAPPAAPECPACGSSMTFACNNAGCAYSRPATAQPAEASAEALREKADAARAYLIHRKLNGVRLEIERLSEEYLRLTGWRLTCENPLSRWLWAKQLDSGPVMLLSRKDAIAMQEDMTPPEYAQDEQERDHDHE